MSPIEEYLITKNIPKVIYQSTERGCKDDWVKFAKGLELLVKQKLSADYLTMMFLMKHSQYKVTREKHIKELHDFHTNNINA